MDRAPAAELVLCGGVDMSILLWKAGVHTVSSCCGHGRVPPYIQVLGGESVKNR